MIWRNRPWRWYIAEDKKEVVVTKANEGEPETKDTLVIRFPNSQIAQDAARRMCERHNSGEV